MTPLPLFARARTLLRPGPRRPTHQMPHPGPDVGPAEPPRLGGPGRARRAPAARAARPSGPAFHLGAVVALVLLAAGGLGLAAPNGPTPAFASIVHHQGYQATVFGWTSWYGSYDMGPLGPGWCIDHGIAAPDAAYGYQPTSIDTETDGDTQAAMAWIATTYAPSSATEAAAVMLALHDLRRAWYPFGVLDVDQLQVGNLGGFGGAEGAVLQRAREVKADGLAHRSARTPFHLDLKVVPTAPGVESVGTARLTDANGRDVAGVALDLTTLGPRLTSAGRVLTGATGEAGFSFVTAEGDNSFMAATTVVDLQPHVFGSTTVLAQRIIIPATTAVSASTTFSVSAPPPLTAPPTTAPPPTTTTRPPTTTTTRPPTTTTTRPATTTTAAPTTTTTRPPSTTTTTPTPTTTTSTTTTAPPTTTTSLPSTTTTTTTTAVPPEVTSPPTPPSPPPTVSRPSLPVTGGPTRAVALIGAGLVLLGASVLTGTRHTRAVPRT